jgi:Gas vesicle protein
MSMNAPVARRPQSSRDLVSAPGSTNLADLLERVLDKGVVIAGEIVISLGAVELLTLKVRLLIASIDKAREIGIDWWETDPFLSSHARERELEGDHDLLKKRLEHLERLLLPPPQEADQEHAEAAQWSNTPPAYLLDKQGKVVAELKQPGQQTHEAEQPQVQKHTPWPVEQPHQEAGLQAQKRTPWPAEQPHAPERTPQSEAAQAEQPAGAEPRMDPAMQERITQAERIAQAMQPVLEELRQPNAQAPQPVEQAWPEGRRDEERPQEDEQPQPPERALRPEAAQAEQPAGAGPLLGSALHERIAQAMRPVLAELPQRIAQARQPVEQARPEGRHEEAQEQPQAPQPEAAQNPAPARVLEEGRMTAKLKHGRVRWHLAVVDLDREGRVIAELEPPGQQAQEEEQNAAPAYILDKDGRVIAELKEPVQQAQEEEQLQTQERAPQPEVQLQEEERPQAPERALRPEAAQAEQPAGAGPLLGSALRERIAQAMRPVLAELPQRIAQARQPVEQARPEGRHEEAQEQPQAPQPEAVQNPVPARVLDREGRVIAEVEQLGQQAQEEEQNAASAYILDQKGSVIAELKPPLEQPHAPERAPQPGAAQAEQPAGAGLLLVPALRERIAQAMRPVLAELPQRIAQARQPVEQARPEGRHEEAQEQEW